jgi:hypothetical protein
MMLTAKQSADLALKYGLDLPAASALSRMALETAEEGEAIAAAFAAPPKPVQLSRDDLKGLSAAEITKAKDDGKLADVLGQK